MSDECIWNDFSLYVHSRCLEITMRMERCIKEALKNKSRYELERLSASDNEVMRRLALSELNQQEN